MYNKHRLSYDLYYSKAIEEFIQSVSTRSTNLFKDLITLDERKEYLKRLYKKKEYNLKI